MSMSFWGQPFTFPQPDGSALRVKGWGNQYHAVFETLNGYTVTQDPVTGYYVYADLAHDAESLVPTAARPRFSDPKAIGLTPGIRLNARAAKAEAHENASLTVGNSRWEIRRNQHRQALRSHTQLPGLKSTPPRRETKGDFTGLCLLVEFPDLPGTIPREQVDDFCNKPGYAGFGNNGSVFDYFLEISNARLRYKNVVTQYYMAKNPRAFYTSEAMATPVRARELIKEALDYLKENKFDFSQLTTDSEGCVYAINVFYAGKRVNSWNKGLWPHSYHLLTPYELAENVLAMDYQITDMAEELSLGTFCHENGHMVCDFPDLYDYGHESSGIGAFCLMCSGANVDEKNPTHVNGYLKYRAGWAEVIAPAVPQQGVELIAGKNQFFIHRKSATEYFLIENRQQYGRDKALPAHGLAIWHIDEQGDNQNEQMTAEHHYECALLQADGLNQLERTCDSYGDSGDLYPYGSNNAFGPASTPRNTWWDGAPSGLSITNIGASDRSMRFDVDVDSGVRPEAAPGLPSDAGEREAVIDGAVKDSIRAICPPGTTVVRATLLGPGGLGHGDNVRMTYYPRIRDRLAEMGAAMKTLTPISFTDPQLKTVGNVCDMVNGDV
jgi:M6 family metalloprotease-like protein